MSVYPWLDVKIRPENGECLPSLAVRLARHGGVRVESLLRLGLGAGERELTELPALPDAVERLAVIGGFDRDQLAKSRWLKTNTGFYVLGRQVPEDWLAVGQRRVAAGHLRSSGDDAFIPLSWSIRAFPCALPDGEVLIDRCPRCRNNLHWIGLRCIWECTDCGFDLRTGPRRLVAPDILEAARELEAYFQTGQASVVPAPFDRLTDIELFKTLSWLALFAGRPLAIKAANAIEGWKILREWPRPLERIVSAEARRQTSRQFAPRRLLGHLAALQCAVDESVAAMVGASIREIVPDDQAVEAAKEAVLMPIADLYRTDPLRKLKRSTAQSRTRRTDSIRSSQSLTARRPRTSKQ